MFGKDIRQTAVPLLEVRDLAVDLPTPAGVVMAVRGVSFDIRPGQVVGMVGESGSGKTITALAIMGLLPKSALIRGSARYRGVELLGMGNSQLRAVRGRRLAMVFQDPMTSLNPVFTVGWQLAEAVLTHHDVSKKEAMARAVELLELVNIPHPKEGAASYPHELSGGMRQRAMIAMAMANEVEAIIADEPTSALDVTIQAQLLETLMRVQEETQVAILLITHDLGVVAGLAEDVLVMYAGRIVEAGSVYDIYRRPRMPYTVGLLGSAPRLDAEDEPLTPIPGSPPSPIDLPRGCPFSPRCPMSRPRCGEAEPELRLIESMTHRSACHFAEELAGDVRPEEVFEVRISDGEPPAVTHG